MTRLLDIYKNRGTRKYDVGGTLDGLVTGMGGPNSAAAIGGSAAGLVGNVVDAANPPNKYGRSSLGSNMAKDVGSMAAAGASFGPWGLAAGAVIGGVKGIIDTKNQEKQEKIMRWNDAFNSQQQSLSKYSAQATMDTNIASGNRGGNYFANGGKIEDKPQSLFTEFVQKKANGGSLSRLSTDTVAVNGPSHEQGGVPLDGNNEVEGGETIKDGYVFSERLGFAQAHKPIAKAIGQLEQKAPSAPVLNSLKRLRQQEDALQLLQEHVRQQNGLQ